MTLKKLFICLFIVLQISGLFLAIRPVFAQAAVTDPWAYAQRWQLFQADQLSKTVDQGLLATGMAALVNSFSFALDKIAYDTATYVASGGKGQGALAFRQGFGQYLETTALDAVGNFIENFSEDALGVNLCKIPDLNVVLNLTIGFRSIYLDGKGGPQSDCSWQELRNNWSREAFEEKYGPGGSQFLAETFSGSLQVNNTDFGIALDTVARLDKIEARERDAAGLARLEGQGFKSLTDLITGNVKTPAQVVKEETSLATNKFRVEASNEQLAGIAASGATQAFVHAGSVFLNTLTSQLLNQILTKGFFGDDGTEGGDDGSAGIAGFFNSPLRSSNSPATNPYGQLLTARPTPQLNNFNIISAFASCPDSPGINNCVIDTDFQKILSIANTGEPLTIQEAMDQGLLHADWQLISPRRDIDNTNDDCYLNKYCYSNIQKLRKVRILPLGFEVAALRSDPDQPWTLGMVVRNFENCLRVNEQGLPDPNGSIVRESSAYPFCHLINPNWVIRAPAMVCDANVYTASLVSDTSAQRQRECVDVKTCLQEGANGSCKGNYGYCTQEKNVWKIPGDACSPEYNTCTTYTNSKTGRNASYLARTVEYGECSVDNVGCRAYSMEKDANGVWIPRSQIAQRGAEANARAKDVSGANANIFFDDAIKVNSSICRPSDNGCTALFSGQKSANGQYLKSEEGEFIVQNKQNTPPTYLKKAPNYLGCYDMNPATKTVEWPTTLAEVQNQVSQNVACNAFASVCTESEVGCESYNPVNGGPMIPGVIGAQNVCASECVGYQTFKQEAGDLAKFSKEKFPLFFIPSNGQSCAPQYAGCDEFTNIDAQAQGGESREYYTDLKYCEKPAADGQNMKTFYTWEGSLSEGLSLRTHTLLPVNQDEFSYVANIQFAQNDDKITASFEVGSPAYNDDSKDTLAQNYQKCNEDNYKERLNNPFAENAAEPDCKAFYDDAGKVYYRLLSRTVTVSNACHPLRKTNSEFYVDESLQANAGLCASKGGVFNGQTGECQRCMNGGRFQNNACIYQTISRPGESTSCPAQANGCRAYTGSTSNNLREVIDDDFEIAVDAPADQVQAVLGPWSPRASVRVSPEATHPQLHSLEVLGNVTRTIASGTFANNAFYELSFWAKGTGQTLEITLSQIENGRENIKGNFTVNTVTGQPSLVSLGGEWQAYRLGPVQFSGTPGDMLLNFQVRARNNERFYIDHVQVQQVRDYIYLVQNSWKSADGNDVPLACDSAPNDGLPGEALGCSAYRDSKQQVRYATGFEKLCREKAVGCEPFWDSQNTLTGDDAEKKQVFQALCNAQIGRMEANTCILSSRGQDPEELGRCTVAVGATSCFVPKIVLESEQSAVDVLPAGAIVPSTLIILGDTPDEAPIFLANRKEFQCKDTARGCQMVGLEEQIFSTESTSSSYRYTDIMVKNDPEQYTETLCRDDLVGCSEYRSSGNISYFKDPNVTGNKLCTYKGQTTPGEPYGWFQDGVGRCSNARDQLCKSNSDCSAPGTCTQIGQVACYDDYQRQGGMYDIWSNSSSSTYKGFVGACPSQFNQCTELIDPADTSLAHPEGQPYYVIFNRSLTSKFAECNGKVGLNDGCVLFNRTSDPNKLFNSTATYLDSERANPRYSVVAPNKTGALDTNIILKVERDRMCSRWLQCANKVRVLDESGKPTTLCYSFRECEQAVGDTCVKWVDDFENNNNIQDASNRLTYTRYITRGTSWYDPEYTGYSLYNKYRVDDMAYLSFDFERLKNAGYLEENDLKFLNDKQYIAYQVNEQFFAPGSGFENLGCTSQNASTEFKACGLNSGGRCYNQKCFYPTGADRFPVDATPIRNGNPSRDGMLKLLEALASDSNMCKGYPEIDTPFPTNVVANTANAKTLKQQPAEDGGSRFTFQDFKQGYDSANVCQDGNCSCGYDKVTYKTGQVDYWTPGNSDSPLAKDIKGICSGGSNNGVDFDGVPCQNDSQCGIAANPDNAADTNEQGKCQFITKVQNQYGFKGYCLEFDFSRPLDNPDQPFECLTWLPIQVSASNFDSYNADEKAGYYRPIDAAGGTGEVYCSVASRVSAGPYDESTLDPDFNGNADAYYNLYFRVDGSVKSNPSFAPQNGGPALNAGCLTTGSDGQAYQNAVCSHNLPKMYTALQSWLWKDVNKRNSVILRLEYGKENSFNDDRWGHDSSNVAQDRANGVSPSEIMYSFAPNAYQGQKEFGVLMHPPRFWNNQEPSGPVGYEHTSDIVSPENNVFRGADLPGKILDVRTMSPHLTSENLNQSLYRSPFESALRKTDLKKIHFIPLSYSESSYGEVPLIMSPIELRFEDLVSKDAIAYLKDDAENQPLGGGGYTQFPTTVSGRDDLVVWNYVLEGNELNNYQFVNYSLFNPNILQNAVDLAGQKNKVATRYVAVYADWFRNNNGVPQFIQNNVIRRQGTDDINEDLVRKPAPDGDNDPFSASCSGDRGNWLAIGMDFNAYGEFLGYISRWCNNVGGQRDTGIQFAVVAELNDQCTEFVQVYNDNVPNRLAATTNKAWTQRLWVESGVVRDEALVSFAHPMSSILLGNFYNNLKREVKVPPFGSINLRSSDFANKNELLSFTFRKPEFAENPFGIPYSCLNEWLGSRSFLFDVEPEDNRASRCAGVYFAQGDALAGQVKNDISNSRLNQVRAREAIYQLFAQSFAVKNRVAVQDQFGHLSSDLQNNVNAVGDFSGSTENGYRRDQFENRNLIPPQIYSLNPARCRQKGAPCIPGEANNVSVNFKNGTVTDYDKDELADEDTNGDGQPDAQIYQISTTAFVNFFAYADDNRMPIRRVMVDWGDGSTPLNSDRKGFYRNHKPFCEIDNVQKFCGRGENNDSRMRDAVTRGLTCSTNSDCPEESEGDQCVRVDSVYGKRFGSSPNRACTEGYFEFIHEYTCSRSDIPVNGEVPGPGKEFVKRVDDASVFDAATRERLLTLGLAPESYVCVYKPKAQVLDNWGWCNGSCKRIDANGAIVGDKVNGCYDDYATGDNLCSFNSPQAIGNFDPWTYYRGQIIVIPPAPLLQSR